MCATEKAAKTLGANYDLHIVSGALIYAHSLNDGGIFF